MPAPQSPSTDPRSLKPVLMPWEDVALSFFARLWGTLGNSFAPVRAVPALCSGPTPPAWTFALLTALPMMLAWGVIPFTKTVTFVPGAQIEPIKTAQGLPLGLDVAQSIGTGLGLSVLLQVAWAIPFLSLLKAFADARVPPELLRTIGLRYVLYRAWLFPCAAVVFYLTTWSAPMSIAPSVWLWGFVVLKVLPIILLLLGALAMATALGASVLSALAVAIVPLILRQIVGLLVMHVVAPGMSDMALISPY